ncbi:hypothetical protein LX32DRAFT_348038 [Colletotrichum zoysiae]|uniref:Uncharacterized protein n=1 Tax=Colletotrichum zoysiae TaxID=1216348 RepID=A0AAD9HJ51_9PEZI|nr:hypothetical protein LX32DRAFT_348038 [Colletotrichum zoysiae]
MHECRLGCITLIFPRRQKRRPRGRGDGFGAVRRVQDPDPTGRPGGQRQHVPGHHFHYAPVGHDSPPNSRQAAHGGGPGSRRQATAFPGHGRRGHVVGDHPHLPALNRGPPSETMFVDPSKSFTIGYDRRRQFGV